MKDTLRSSVVDAGKHLLQELRARFVEIPKTSCECGKPVVFPDSRKPTFNCTRCGNKYRLIVSVEKVTK